MRNVEGDFDPNRLIFVDFDLAAYGARAFDINYHTSYWLPDWGELDFLLFLLNPGSTDQNRSFPVADQQKMRFRTEPDQKNKLIFYPLYFGIGINSIFLFGLMRFRTEPDQIKFQTLARTRTNKFFKISDHFENFLNMKNVFRYKNGIFENLSR